MSHHKLVFFLSLLVLLFPLSFAYERYKDWDNAQMIKGLARDFPILVAEIEVATGLDLEIKKDCMITQEKAGAGVRTCEISYKTKNNVPLDQRVISEAYSLAVSDSDKFSMVKSSETANGSRANYRNKQSCTFTKIDTLKGSCIVAVREANISLANIAFSNN